MERDFRDGKLSFRPSGVPQLILTDVIDVAEEQYNGWFLVLLPNSMRIGTGILITRSMLPRVPGSRALPATHIKISFTPEKLCVGLVKQENGLGKPLKDAGAVGLAVDAENREILLMLGEK